MAAILLVVDGLIEIRGLRCVGRQGVTDEEREVEQEYRLDVAVRSDIAAAIEADDVAHATDISAIATTVRAAVSERPRALVERIAHDVARALLDTFPEITEARVKVSKPHPEGLDADAEAVELVLHR